MISTIAYISVGLALIFQMGGMGMGGNMMYYVITGIAMLASKLVGDTLQRRFKQYSQTPTQLSGKEIAEKMLADYGITDVQVVSVKGTLTDHYNPANKTVNLSEVVYNERNVAAAAVSAHECGHAVQHATSYGFLKMRSNLVPIVNISTKFLNIILMIGVGLAAAGMPQLLLLGVLMFATTTLFSFITLPVEFNASNRALKWLEETNATGTPQGQKQAKNALWWAAMTYTVAALASLGQLFYFIMMYLNATSRNS